MFFSHYNNHNSQRLPTREITIHKICNLNTVLNTKLSFVFNGYCNRTYMTVQVKPHLKPKGNVIFVRIVWSLFTVGDQHQILLDLFKTCAVLISDRNNNNNHT
jgi:hypothetical protein